MYAVLGVTGFGAAWPATGAAQILYRTPERIMRLTASSGRLAWAQERAGTDCFHLYRRGLRRLRRTPHAVRNLAVDGRLVVWNTPHTIHGVVL